ncbi:hypothetical protein BZA05DRAFT_383735 [Tricharina praecox]|uniref:uncharacterized protein n=1 Tax=Tricharina praecox TaxID=43433 RepID=UPI0022207CD0|nr:uncharacterized protein BZA05DRAFT_383735 [Tricharina praecox]KAI5859233.1 hypothetical protein BZA05DRAFT_383735 [Tricharina praecox]
MGILFVLFMGAFACVLGRGIGRGVRGGEVGGGGKRLDGCICGSAGGVFFDFASIFLLRLLFVCYIFVFVFVFAFGV